MLAVLLFGALPVNAASDTTDSTQFAPRMLPIMLTQAQELVRRSPNTSSEVVGVIFPDMPDPYRKIFAEIIEGIEDQTKFRVRAIPISAAQDPADLAAQVKRSGIRIVIALGARAMKAASNLDLSMGVIAGGIIAVADPDKQVGISVTPDPALLFSNLKNLLPTIRRVIVIYNPQKSEWIIKAAREAARAHGMELSAFEARDLASAAHLYESQLAAADGQKDALWLPQDTTTVEEDTILPIVLRDSWSRNVPFFSSTYVHVLRGALFALYPKNVEMGRSLANLAIRTLAGEPPKRGFTLLREVNTALNTRTASHVGVSPARTQRAFDYVYPER